MRLHNRGREIRLAKNLTVTEVARRAGVTRQTVLNVELRQDYNPSADTMRRYADAIGETLGDVFWTTPEAVA